MKELGFEPLAADLSVFTNTATIIAIYMDNILFAGPSKQDIQQLKNSFKSQFSTADFGQSNYFLDIFIVRDRPNRILSLGQTVISSSLSRNTVCGMALRISIPPIGGEKYQAPEEDHQATDKLRTQYQSLWDPSYILCYAHGLILPLPSQSSHAMAQTQPISTGPRSSVYSGVCVLPSTSSSHSGET